MSSTDNVLVRAAASSIASGSPSSGHAQRFDTRSVIGCAARPAHEQLDRVVDRERTELDEALAVDAERTLAGAQDAQLGPGVEQLLDEIGGRVDDVLAVVEDDDRRRHAAPARRARRRRRSRPTRR